MNLGGAGMMVSPEQPARGLLEEGLVGRREAGGAVGCKEADFSC